MKSASLSHSPCPHQTNSDISQEEKLSSAGLLPETKRAIQAPLTEENLRCFNKIEKQQGGLAGEQQCQTGSSSFKAISKTAPRFRRQAYNNGILPSCESKSPTNINELRSRLDQDLGASLPTEFMYHSYVHIVNTAENENTMMTEIYSKFTKSYYGKDYRTTINHPFTGFPKEVGFNHNLSPAQPDLFQGFGEESFKPFPIEQELGGAAVVIDDAENSITLSHLAAEFKGFGKDMKQARIQSAYDGATLVYARNKALEYIGEADSVGHAAVLTFTTDGETINFFAHFSAPSAESGVMEYHQYPVCTRLFPTSSYEEFKTYWKRLHNAQEHAKEAADDLRRRLKNHWEVRTIPAAVSRPEVSKDTEGEPEPKPEPGPAPADGSLKRPRSSPRTNKPNKHGRASAASRSTS